MCADQSCMQLGTHMFHAFVIVSCLWLSEHAAAAMASPIQHGNVQACHMQVRCLLHAADAPLCAGLRQHPNQACSARSAAQQHLLQSRASSDQSRWPSGPDCRADIGCASPTSFLAQVLYPWQLDMLSHTCDGDIFLGHCSARAIAVQYFSQSAVGDF